MHDLPTYLGLCEESAVMAEPWRDAGHPCICVDLAVEPGVRNGIEFVRADVMDWWPPNRRYVFVAAFPPCTDLAVSGARWFRDKGVGRAVRAVDLVARCEAIARWAEAPYLIENPVSRLSSLHKPDHTFDPCDFGGYLDPPGDTYTKRTCLWTGGGFVMPSPRAVEPVDGSVMHLLPPSADRAKKRSVTPAGFARAVFLANQTNPATCGKE